MKFHLSDKDFSEIKADIAVILVDGVVFKTLQKSTKDDLTLLGFEGKDNTSAYLSQSKTLYIGVGDFKDLDYIRVGSANASKYCFGTAIKSIKIHSYNDDFDTTKALVEGFRLGNYKFDTYKKSSTSKLKEVYICTKNSSGKNIDTAMAQKAIAEGLCIAKSTIFTRQILNRTPEDLTPKRMAKVAKELAKTYDLGLTILNEKDLKKLNMNAFLAVSRASVNPPRLIHLSYKHKNAKSNIALVGKGLTYDSGGLSLKPSDFMVTMKADKGGACAILGILRGVCEMQLPINLDVVIGATENMIGGDAYKPDDILTARSGKTIEIRNTDAEGRLVLSDCLTYTQEIVKDIDYIFDYATLTGACVVGLGEYTSGIMGHNKALKREFEDAGENSGDLTNPLHFNKHLEGLIISPIADICNTGSTRYGGSLTAGLFLNHFIEEKNKNKWLHFDIAGPAYVEKAWGVNSFGASGAGVRFTLQWLLKKYK